MTTQDRFDPRPAAALLSELWHSGRQTQELPSEIRPRSLDEGSDIQGALIAKLGEAVVGWKLGVGSLKLKAQSGVGRSIAGRLLSRFALASQRFTRLAP